MVMMVFRLMSSPVQLNLTFSLDRRKVLPCQKRAGQDRTTDDFVCYETWMVSHGHKMVFLDLSRVGFAMGVMLTVLREVMVE